MKLIQFLLVALFATSSLQGQGIEFFHGSWEEVLAEAKEEQKLIFVDAYTTWCGPCKRMAKDVFTQEKVGKVYNEKFINVKMDMEAEENVAFVGKYPVSAYPTLMFINDKGEVVLKKVGGQKAEGLLALAEDVKKLDDRTDDFVEGYESGNRDYDFVLGYIKALNKVEKSSLKVSNDFLKNNKSLSDSQLDAFLLEAAVEADSKLFDKLIARKGSILSTTDNDEVFLKVKKACDCTVDKAIDFEIIDLADEAIAKYSAFHDKKKAQEYGYLTKMKYYKGTGLNEDYVIVAGEYFKKMAKKDNEKLKPLIKKLSRAKASEPVNDLLLKASKQLSKNEDNWENLITYAQALLVNDEKSKAREIAEKALQKTKEDRAKAAINKFIDMLDKKA
jgi:thiol-disulfide isomerase/thioredoxin